MFTKRLKDLRLQAGLTQREIADYFNTSPQSYAQWEKGLRKPSSDSLEKLARYFNVSTDYLLGKTEFKQPAPNLLSEAEQAFQTAIEIHQLTETAQETLKADLVAFIEKRAKELALKGR
ncbi:helix-turn-helix domain-containing protein [Streptococcus sp. zg-86]|uniref:Helix-turn-helix domain-containing protein n=1 Tax=Streptococcus zhangguiae TaxID=2664091 RepID=A0A6I4RBA9_9STRE|nr:MULTISPECIES: helix-turn-helix domain-containing protein [unclassified Streptococcus]MTB64728.1 helix-turn-helix domain-containing protein [Streptococcus sp. zg-86]MTB91300.1 helix-turn-helix domain-containing protein [Streptococcus sp. zg-36]MTB91476.1 helix-turn-helix domain-containing protein [Streptococcus sp. zg-36]MWV56769.1 helix-turn-helix domain-containing protein [Streptococcus sp. zg-70]QTH48501.1 helix-turn-helix domain-containing protein [Streptococcus sp. zg-86]